MQQPIIRTWHHRNLWSYLLLPISCLYRLVITIRRYCYRKKIFNTYKPPVPVVIVGNITVGGTGKTPLVIALTELLIRQGYSPGIVSRGYGGKSTHYPVSVTAMSSPQQVGDEPLLIARRTQIPVVVDPNRVRAVQCLLQNYSCDIIISDDGLQHYALKRDIEIAVLDDMARFGNGYCLPAGPLREPISRLSEVDYVIVNGQARADEFAMQLQPLSLINLTDNIQKPLAELRNQTVHAVAGIGNPHRFFHTLREAELQLIEHIFPDHHVYNANELQFADDLPIIMTEKDAVKCTGFSLNNGWYLPVTAKLSTVFESDLIHKIQQLT